ncbi:hypothetical protein FAH66_10140 [Neisseria subflava]|nr:hypothetical protein FAH66_10140 [Neisseria subflava]
MTTLNYNLNRQKATKSFFRCFFILIESNRNSCSIPNNQITFRFKCFKNSFFIAIETLKQPYIFSQMKNISLNTLFSFTY